MRELKYQEVGGGSSGHPELEEIAAFLDGRLPAAERAGITAHLSVCTECLELFTETARALEEMSAGTTGGEVVPFDRPLRSPRHWLPAVAAAAALLAAVGLTGYGRFAPQTVEVAELVEPLAESPGAAGAVWAGTALRGEQEDAGGDYALSFLVGAHLVGFQTAVEAGDSAVAGDAARLIANHLHQGLLLEEEVKRFRAAQRALLDEKKPAQRALLDEKKPAPTSKYAKLVEANDEAIRDSFAEVHLPFGMWTQAGYIAARTGSREWFERRANRRFLSYLLRQDDEEIDPGARKALEKIREVWDRGKLDGGDFQQLAAQLGTILDTYENLSRREDFLLEE